MAVKMVAKRSPSHDDLRFGMPDRAGLQQRRREAVERQRDKPSGIPAEPPRHVPQRRAKKNSASQKRQSAEASASKLPSRCPNPVAMPATAPPKRGRAVANARCQTRCHRCGTDPAECRPDRGKALRQFPVRATASTLRRCGPPLRRQVREPVRISACTSHNACAKKQSSSNPARNCGRPKRSRVKYGRIRSSRVFYHVGGSLRRKFRDIPTNVPR